MSYCHVGVGGWVGGDKREECQLVNRRISGWVVGGWVGGWDLPLGPCFKDQSTTGGCSLRSAFHIVRSWNLEFSMWK